MGATDRQVERPAGEVIVGGGPLDAADRDGLGVLHADLDAFYASVEVLKDPRLRGRPVLVGGTGRRGVVSSASYEARAFGCRNAMPMGQARRLCPQAVVLPPDFATYRRCSKDVLRLFHAVTPLVEPLALDEAFLDVRGARRLFGDAVAIARSLRAQVRERTGLAVTVGVASCKFLAKLASTRGKPDGLLVVPPSRELAFLHPLPVEALWGAGPATIAALQRYGLRTVGDVARTPQATLERALGPALGAHLAALARARDDRPVVPDEVAKSVGSEETFARDVDDPDVLAREVLRCCVRVGERLRDSELAGRTVTLKLRYADFRTVTRSRTLPVPTADDSELYAVARAQLERLGLAGARVRLVGVTVANLVRGGGEVQLRLDRDGRPGWEAAVRAADAIRGRFGDDAVTRASLASDRPEEAYEEFRGTLRPRSERLLDPSDEAG